jgi:hypothetical protein
VKHEIKVPVLRDKRVPWYETFEFRALAEVRRAFRPRGALQPKLGNAEASLWGAVFWALYEVGRLVDEFERRSRAGESVHAVVRTHRHEDNRVVLEFALESVNDGAHSTSLANDAPDTLRSERQSDVHAISDVRLDRVEVG